MFCKTFGMMGEILISGVGCLARLYSMSKGGCEIWVKRSYF